MSRVKAVYNGVSTTTADPNGAPGVTFWDQLGAMVQEFGGVLLSADNVSGSVEAVFGNVTTTSTALSGSSFTGTLRDAAGAIASYYNATLVSVTDLPDPQVTAVITGVSLDTPSPFRPGNTFRDDLNTLVVGYGATANYD